jgi:hypothetical protein
LQHTITVQRMSRVIALPIHRLASKRMCLVNATLWPLYPLERDPERLVQGAGWGWMPIWTGTENPVDRGFRSPDRPARSESLYRLLLTVKIDNLYRDITSYISLLREISLLFSIGSKIEIPFSACSDLKHYA